MRRSSAAPVQTNARTNATTISFFIESVLQGSNVSSCILCAPMNVQENPGESGNRQYWVISAGAVILAMMSIQMASLGFSPLQPAMQKDLAASYSQMGLFTGMYGLIALLISLPAG